MATNEDDNHPHRSLCNHLHANVNPNLNDGDHQQNRIKTTSNYNRFSAIKSGFGSLWPRKRPCNSRCNHHDHDHHHRHYNYSSSSASIFSASSPSLLSLAYYLTFILLLLQCFQWQIPLVQGGSSTRTTATVVIESQTIDGADDQSQEIYMGQQDSDGNDNHNHHYDQQQQPHHHQQHHNNHPNNNNNNHVGTTSATDIRKLLEDYIQYLASLPDINSNSNRQQRRNNENDEKQSGNSVMEISTADTSDRFDQHPQLPPQPPTSITYRTFVPINNPNIQSIADVFDTRTTSTSEETAMMRDTDGGIDGNIDSVAYLESTGSSDDDPGRFSMPIEGVDHRSTTALSLNNIENVENDSLSTDVIGGENVQTTPSPVSSTEQPITTTPSTVTTVTPSSITNTTAFTTNAPPNTTYDNYNNDNNDDYDDSGLVTVSNENRQNGDDFISETSTTTTTTTVATTVVNEDDDVHDNIDENVHHRVHHYEHEDGQKNHHFDSIDDIKHSDSGKIMDGAMMDENGNFGKIQNNNNNNISLNVFQGKNDDEHLNPEALASERAESSTIRNVVNLDDQQVIPTEIDEMAPEEAPSEEEEEETAETEGEGEEEGKGEGTAVEDREFDPQNAQKNDGQDLMNASPTTGNSVRNTAAAVADSSLVERLREMTNEELLEQLKRTKELLGIQIERLKALEMANTLGHHHHQSHRTVGKSARSFAESSGTPLITTVPSITTTTTEPSASSSVTVVTSASTETPTYVMVPNTRNKNNIQDNDLFSTPPTTTTTTAKPPASQYVPTIITSPISYPRIVFNYGGNPVSSTSAPASQPAPITEPPPSPSTNIDPLVSSVSGITTMDYNEPTNISPPPPMAAFEYEKDSSITTTTPSSASSTTTGSSESDSRIENNFLVEPPPETPTPLAPSETPTVAPPHTTAAPLLQNDIEEVREGVDVNDNNDKNETNVETMILTHVPKITIIHKIMKPFRMVRDDNEEDGDDDDGGAVTVRPGAGDETLDGTVKSVDGDEDSQTPVGPGTGNTRFMRLNKEMFGGDEMLYKEALRKHQDLIRSTMSSMSLYPAAFKRYKVQHNNKVNSVGEIYLLPNFFGDQKNQTQINPPDRSTLGPNISPTVLIQINDTGSIDSIKTQLPKEEPRLAEAKNQKEEGDPGPNEVTAPPTAINDNVSVEEMGVSGEDFSPKTVETKPTSNGKKSQDDVVRRKKLRAKLLLNQQSILAFNRNPENILKLYRPRFKNRKHSQSNQHHHRFRKVRLPFGKRTTAAAVAIPFGNLSPMINGNISTNLILNAAASNNNTWIMFHDISSTSTATTTTEPDVPPKNPATTQATPSATISTTTTPIARLETTTTPRPEVVELKREQLNSDSNESTSELEHEQPQARSVAQQAVPPVPVNRTTVTEDSAVIIQDPPVIPINPTNGTNLISDSLVDIYRNYSNFKIFCTFDAHRPVTVPDSGPSKVDGADTEGRFFDINTLEQNLPILKHCTHLVYAFANVDLNGDLYPGGVSPIVASAANQADTSTTDQLRNNLEMNQANLVRLKHIKKHLPHLKLLVAVGGWDTPPQLFSLMVATTRLRERLSSNVFKFVLDHQFDGAIIAWFYPVYGQKSSLDSRSTRATGQSLFQLDDKQNLMKFVRSIRNRFDSVGQRRLELGLMVPPFQEFIDRGYEARKLSELVDHLILMTYDYYGSWENQVHHFAPLFPSNTSLDERNRKFNINYTVNYWINEKGAQRNKTAIGVAFYGRSFTLANHSATDAKAGSLALGPGIAGPLTNRPGLLSFNELCELYLGNPNVRLNEDEYRITANLQLFDQWVGFDDELSLYLKTKYAIGQQLSGIFIWSINYDDYRNRCGWGQFPLLKAINKAVEHCTVWKQCGPMDVKPQPESKSQNN